MIGKELTECFWGDGSRTHLHRLNASRLTTLKALSRRDVVNTFTLYEIGAVGKTE
jgi:hypothetical protein